LEPTRDTINEITWKVGYEDINSFRRLFIKHTGLSPKNHRNCRKIRYVKLAGKTGFFQKVFMEAMALG